MPGLCSPHPWGFTAPLCRTQSFMHMKNSLRSSFQCMLSCSLSDITPKNKRVASTPDRSTALEGGWVLHRQQRWGREGGLWKRKQGKKKHVSKVGITLLNCTLKTSKHKFLLFPYGITPFGGIAGCLWEDCKAEGELQGVAGCQQGPHTLGLCHFPPGTASVALNPGDLGYKAPGVPR